MKKLGMFFSYINMASCKKIVNCNNLELTQTNCGHEVRGHYINMCKSCTTTSPQTFWGSGKPNN